VAGKTPMSSLKTKRLEGQCSLEKSCKYKRADGECVHGLIDTEPCLHLIDFSKGSVKKLYNTFERLTSSVRCSGRFKCATGVPNISNVPKGAV